MISIRLTAEVVVAKKPCAGGPFREFWNERERFLGSVRIDSTSEVAEFDSTSALMFPIHEQKEGLR